MITNGAIPRACFALALICHGSFVLAQGPVPKPRTQVALTPKPGSAAKASSADPFEEAPRAARPEAPSAAAAQAKAPSTPAALPTPNLPPKEMVAFMKRLEGSWKCDTKFSPGSLGPGAQALDASTAVTIKREAGGFSWHGEFKLAKTSATTATNGMFQIGYAGGIKQATFLSYDSIGSAMMGSGAIDGDSVTFDEQGFLKGVKVRVRETLATRGAGKIFHRVEIEQGKGYQTVAEDTCAK